MRYNDSLLMLILIGGLVLPACGSPSRGDDDDASGDDDDMVTTPTVATTLETCLSQQFILGEVHPRACSGALTRCTGLAPCLEQRALRGNFVGWVPAPAGGRNALQIILALSDERAPGSRQGRAWAPWGGRKDASQHVRFGSAGPFHASTW